VRAIGYYKPLAADVAESISRHDDPLSAIKQYCAEELHQLVATIPGDESGAPVTPNSTDSERLQSLIQYFNQAERRQALVVIPDSTHLAGDLELLVKALIDIEVAGGDVRCANFDAPDAVQDGLEKLSLPGRRPGRQRRIQEAIQAKAARGQVLGRVPFGYRGGPDGMMHPVLEEAEIVAQVFDWYLGNPTPPDELGNGANGIPVALDFRDTSRTPGQRSPPLPARDASFRQARHGMRIVTNHQPIVERASFNRAQEILESRKPIRKRRSKSSFPLGGVLECGTCGNGMNGVTRARSWTLSDGSTRSRQYRYYACRLFSRSDKGENRHASWGAEELELRVQEKLSSLDKRTMDKTLASDDASTSSGIANAESRFMRQYRSVAHGQAPLRSLVANVQELERARDAAPALNDMDDASASADEGTTVREAVAALGDDQNDRKETISRLIAKIVVGLDEIELTLNT